MQATTHVEVRALLIAVAFRGIPAKVHLVLVCGDFAVDGQGEPTAAHISEGP